jgi:hypothetical protein
MNRAQTPAVNQGRAIENADRDIAVPRVKR